MALVGGDIMIDMEVAAIKAFGETFPDSKKRYVEPLAETEN